MIEPHPDIETPESSTEIWRYMTLDKLLHLLASSSLWLSRCDFFEDGWEGRYSDATYDTFKNTLIGSEDRIERLWQWHQDANCGMRNCLYVNCWHINQEESAALWQIYSNYGKCVAVKTTVHKLRDALAGTDVPVFAGRVKYCDYATEPMPMGNLFTPFLRKRRSFTFEQELRLLHWQPELLSPDRGQPAADLPKGVAVPVDVASLILEVYLTPKADGYMHEAITALFAKFGFGEVKIHQSNLFSEPL